MYFMDILCTTFLYYEFGQYLMVFRRNSNTGFPKCLYGSQPRPVRGGGGVKLSTRISGCLINTQNKFVKNSELAGY